MAVTRRDLFRVARASGLATAIFLLFQGKAEAAGYWRTVGGVCRVVPPICEPSGDWWNYKRWYECTGAGCFPTTTYRWFQAWCGC
jgi:hypothetical protein